MCGINGVIAKGMDIGAVEAKLTKMNDLIVHRGPDQDGMFTQQGPDYSIGMAMRRLSIIDLATGRQPIYSDDRSIVIIFNGEIYNYKILKSALESEGIEFNTNSDTEVILKLYEKHGHRSFGMLDGMFSFSIYDNKVKKIFIARDFFGEKPLYYYPSNQFLFWASELKSIVKILPTKPDICPNGLNLYFRLTYIPAPSTIYRGIYKLNANHFIEFDCVNFSMEVREISQDLPQVTIEDSFKSVKQQTHDLIQESVCSRLVADVPVGTFLSGGVDSSIISLCVAQQAGNKIDTFSIGFKKPEFDESSKSKLVSKLINSNHHEFIVDEHNLTADIDKILLNFDEPFADSSALASYIVAKKTSKYVKVALTGDGGDEVFGGYNKYYIGKLNSTYIRFMPQYFHQTLQSLSEKFLSTKDDQRGSRFKVKRLLKAVDYEGSFYYNIIALGFSGNEVADILKNDYYVRDVLDYYKEKIPNSKSITDFRNIDRLLSLEGDMLVKVDRTSMLSSIECRAPFLNRKLWNFTDQLPEDYLIKGWDKKYLLKKAFEEYFPKGFLNKSKKGFGVPVGDWLRTTLKNELLAYLNKDFMDKQNIFEVETIERLVYDHLSGAVDNTFRVWTFFCFQKWYKNTYE